MKFRKKEEPGRFYLRTGQGIQLVKPGDVIDVDPAVLGKHRNRFDCLDEVPPEPEPEQTVGLVLEHRGGGRFNVINEATGEAINDALLSKTEAEALIDKVTAADDGDEPDDDGEGDGKQTDEPDDE